MKPNTQQTTRLRTWREERGLTLDDIAGLTGYSVAFLSRVERGQRNLRPLDRVQMARAIGAPVGDLFDPGRIEVIR